MNEGARSSDIAIMPVPQPVYDYVLSILNAKCKWEWSIYKDRYIVCKEYQNFMIDIFCRTRSFSLVTVAGPINSDGNINVVATEGTPSLDFNDHGNIEYEIMKLIEQTIPHAMFHSNKFYRS